MKHILLIAGGGTLGTYTAKELLRLGHKVTVICLEEKTSDSENLTFIRANATLEFMEEHFQTNRYDGIVNFLHYTTLEAYIPWHRLLEANTDHLIFLSSYRIYADQEHPLTENAPRLLDVVTEPVFLATENYALPKSRCEDFMRRETDNTKWTIVRPVISFSERRFDLLMLSGQALLDAAASGEPVYMPESRRYLTAGLDWAGNSGKLIANLLFKDAARGEAFTISSAPGLTWDDVAQLYTELIGLKVEWVEEDTYLAKNPQMTLGPDEIEASKISWQYWGYKYDRKFDRAVDNRKVLAVTGLRKEDFTSLREGLIIELERLQNKS
jgi:nucleoside-diphosphate-sugar epimerase